MHSAISLDDVTMSIFSFPETSWIAVARLSYFSVPTPASMNAVFLFFRISVIFWVRMED